MKSTLAKLLWKNLLLPIAAVASIALTVSAAQAQGIFPDKNLEAVVRRYVFEKRNNAEPLTEKDVESISTIEGKKKGITNLAGLEKCRSLALLDLEGNEIADASPIKDLKFLQSLNLAGNKLKEVAALEGLTKLQYLELSRNEIADIGPLAKLTAMRSLYLAQNQIKDVKAVEGMEKLWSLYLDGNQVTDLAPLAKLKWLSSLGLAGNGVTDIGPLTGLTEWKYLFLQNNKLADLGPLVEMAKKDREGQMRFAPFWRVYLGGNPLSDDAKTKQVEELKKLGTRVDLTYGVPQ